MPTATKVMLIRHAEKPDGSIQGVDANGTDDPESLTVQGWQRAGALARFFAPVTTELQHPGIVQPQFLFASGPITKEQKKAGDDGSKSQRPEQTITPLSQLLNVEINLGFLEGQEKEVAAAAAAVDGVALIAWQHESIPAIASSIPGVSGAIPSKWPGNRFDVVWVFDLQASGGYTFIQIPQMLLAGDLPTVIE
jgi:broad specificity phosphatase PhoE